MLLCLAALWGASFLFIRVSTPILGPILLVFLRVSIAAASLGLYSFMIRRKISVISHWKAYLILGAINAAIPFTFISIAELRLSAALAAILNATTPMFTAVVARVFLGDQFNVLKVCGLVLGLFGVMIGVGGASGFSHGSPILWAACSLAAALSYGLGGVYASVAFRNEKPIDMAFGQQLGATVWLLPVAFIRAVRLPVSATIIASVLALAILATAAAYLIYFRLMTRVGPVKTMSVTFLVPIFGLLWGALFLGEPLTWHLVLALITILISVGLISNQRMAFSVKLRKSMANFLGKGDSS